MSESTQRILLGTLLIAAVAPANALNESRLWLQRSHKQLKPELLAAAQLVEKSPDCVEIVSGEMDAERSVDDAPVFRIVCRNKAGYTYVVRVTNAGQPDAAIESMPRPDPSQQKSSAPPHGVAAAKTGASSMQVEALDRDSALRKCEEVLRRRTGSMSGLQIDLANARGSSTADGNADYEIDFEARDPSGDALKFRAVCHVGASAAVNMELRPRSSAAVSAAPEKGHASAEPDAVNSAVKPAEALKPSQTTSDDGWEVVE